MARYVPETHTGTKAEIIRGLMDEAGRITRSGFLRLHAQNRELQRIKSQLGELGVTLLVGTEEDEGYLLAVKDHRPGCSLNTTDVCHCPSFYKVEGSP